MSLPETARPRASIYVVRAHACPHVVNRVVGLFAQQELIPSRLVVRQDGDALAIRLVQRDLPAHRAAVIAEKIRAMVAVESVRLAARSYGEASLA